MAKSIHKTRATAIDNISQDHHATQREEKACKLLDIIKTLMFILERLQPLAMLGQWTQCGRHLLVTKHMGNTFLRKQVSCKLIHLRAKSCVFV